MIKGLKAVKLFESSKRKKEKLSLEQSTSKVQKQVSVSPQNSKKILPCEARIVKKYPIKVKIVNRRRDNSNKVRDLMSRIEYMEKKNETLLKISKQLQIKNEESKLNISDLKEKINSLEK